VRNELLLKLAR